MPALTIRNNNVFDGATVVFSGSAAECKVFYMQQRYGNAKPVEAVPTRPKLLAWEQHLLQAMLALEKANEECSDASVIETLNGLHNEIKYLLTRE